MALKVFERGCISPSMWKLLRREATICLGLAHPGVVRLHDVAFENERIALVFEQALGGDLMDRLMQSGPLQPAAARHVFRQLVGAVAHCHARQIFHADLKPENILLVEPPSGSSPAAADRLLTVKIADFGLARDFTDDPDTPKTMCKGTVAFMPPEVYCMADYDPAAVDCWGLGITLHLMLTCRRPNAPPPGPKIYRKGGFPAYDPNPWRQQVGPVDGPLATLLSGLLDPDPKARWTLEQVAAAAWVQGADGFVPAAADAAAETAGAAAAAALQWPQEAQPRSKPRGRDLLAFDTGGVLDLGAPRPGGLAVFAEGEEDFELLDFGLDGLNDAFDRLA